MRTRKRITRKCSNPHIQIHQLEKQLFSPEELLKIVDEEKQKELKTKKHTKKKYKYPDIIWLTKNRIKQYTNIKNNVGQKLTKLPHGLSFIQYKTLKYSDKEITNSIDAMIQNNPNYVKGSESDILILFRDISKQKIGLQGICKKVSDSQARILIYLFDEVIKWMKIKKNTPTYRFLFKTTTVGILKYFTGKGIPCHIDNIGSNDGPVVTINIGNESYYDLLPIFFTKEELKDRCALRIKIPNRTYTIMDGETRFCWQHCIPYDIPHTNQKYTIRFTFRRLKIKNNPMYNDWFKHTFYTLR